MIKQLYAVSVATSILILSNQVEANFHLPPDDCESGRICDAKKECDYYMHRYGSNETLFNRVVQSSDDPLVRQSCVFGEGFVGSNDIFHNYIPNKNPTFLSSISPLTPYNSDNL